MGKFDTVLEDMGWLVSLGQRARKSDVALLHQATKVLRDYEKWEPLIQAAGKVDTDKAIRVLDNFYLAAQINPFGEDAEQAGMIHALLLAIPKEARHD